MQTLQDCSISSQRTATGIGDKSSTHTYCTVDLNDYRWKKHCLAFFSCQCRLEIAVGQGQVKCHHLLPTAGVARLLQLFYAAAM